jgi:hypothetical protein
MVPRGTLVALIYYALGLGLSTFFIAKFDKIFQSPIKATQMRDQYVTYFHLSWGSFWVVELNIQIAVIVPTNHFSHKVFGEIKEVSQLINFPIPSFSGCLQLLL